MGRGSLWTTTLARLWRDRLSAAACCIFALLLLASFAGAPLVGHMLGHTSDDQFPYAANISQKPVGPFTEVPDLTYALGNTASGALVPPPKRTRTTLFVLGADGPLGRDELLRVLAGGKTSLEIAIGGALFALLIGLPLGAVAGYFGGLADAAVSRLTETVMAFPLMLFLVFASVQLDSALRPIGWGSIVPSGVLAEALLIGVFTSFYPTRLVRAQLVSLRHVEFVESAEMIGSSRLRILYRDLLPHVVPGLVVWAAIAIATNILLEVGLSFIGAGLQASTPSWGSLLSTTWGTVLAPSVYSSQSYTPWQTAVPTIAILLAVLSLNQVSEGLRRALDPRAHR